MQEKSRLFFDYFQLFCKVNLIHTFIPGGATFIPRDATFIPGGATFIPMECVTLLQRYSKKSPYKYSKILLYLYI